MKFKNYVNKLSNSNRIYTKRVIREMKLKDFFAKKKELLSQYDAIGLPKPDELKNSPNVNYVEDPNEVFGGRWESVGVNGGVANMKGFNGMTGGAAPVLEGGVEMNVTPEQQKFYEDIQKQVKIAPDSYISASGPEITNIEDIYNFEPWEHSQLFDSQKNIKENLKGLFQNTGRNILAALNNLGVSQQEAGKLVNYILSTSLDLSDEEIKQIYQSYLKKQSK